MAARYWEWSREKLERELERRVAARDRSEILSITGPPRSRFAYASAVTRANRMIGLIAGELEFRRQHPWAG